MNESNVVVDAATLASFALAIRASVITVGLGLVIGLGLKFPVALVNFSFLVWWHLSLH